MKKIILFFFFMPLSLWAQKDSLVMSFMTKVSSNIVIKNIRHDSKDFFITQPSKEWLQKVDSLESIEKHFNQPQLQLTYQLYDNKASCELPIRANIPYSLIILNKSIHIVSSKDNFIVIKKGVVYLDGERLEFSND